MPDDIQFWKSRRALIEQKREVPPGTWLEGGRGLAEAGYFTDALDFFKKAGTDESRDEILKIASLAAEEGDFFLYTLACQTLGVPPDPGQLEILAGNARHHGLLVFQAKALALLGRTPEAPQGPEAEPVAASEAAVAQEGTGAQDGSGSQGGAPPKAGPQGRPPEA